MAFFHSNFMLQSSHEDEQNLPSTSLASLLSPCAPQEFQVGVNSQFWKRSMSFQAGAELCEEMTQNNHGEDELSDDGSQLGERKRRLNMEQVKTLEKNFELGTKLEPERKMRLARDLGLQPRQVAIWFQNRRARWKTKQLEKDYDLLKRQLKAAKAENDALQAQNQRLHAEILALKNRETIESINLNKETEGSSSNRSENSCEVKLEISRNPDIDSPVATARPALFPSSVMRHNAVEQLFQNPPRPEIHIPTRMDHAVKEESSFCNMLCGVDDQTPFWAWMEHPNFS